MLNIALKELEINGKIKDQKLRVIDSSGAPLGILSFSDALKISVEKGLDLVKIAPNADPPVCKIMNYGKYRFKQSKKERELKKNQKLIEVKEIRLSLNIDLNDFNTKVSHAIKFLKSGNKVKISIRFKGREIFYSNFGLKIVDRFLKACSEYAVAEKQAKLDGKNMIAYLLPKITK